MGLRWVARRVGDVEFDGTEAGAENARLAYRAGSTEDLIAVEVVDCSSTRTRRERERERESQVHLSCCHAT